MAGTRSSARLNSSPQSEKSSGGTKRKAEDSSPAGSNKSKRGRPSKDTKEQKTLEETLPTADDKNENEDVEIKDAEVEADANGNGESHERDVSAHTD
jgi:hypothetical protein